MKKLVSKLLVSGLVMTLLFTNTAINGFAAEESIGQVGNTLEDKSSEKEYFYDKCKISYVITEKHYEGYIVNVVITNTSNEEICDWKLQMVTDFSIENNGNDVAAHARILNNGMLSVYPTTTTLSGSGSTDVPFFISHFYY